MKRYSTKLSNGHVIETSLAHEASSIQNFDDAQVFLLSGKPVSAQEFYVAVREANDAAFEKKNQTHKRVRVLHGSSVANYVTKWIAR
jgi:hypothetical protein